MKYYYQLTKISECIPDDSRSHSLLYNTANKSYKMINDYDYDSHHKISMMNNRHKGCISHSYILHGIHLHTLEDETTRRPRSFSFKFGIQDLDYHKQNKKYIKAKYK